jgi:hypothetical protein
LRQRYSLAALAKSINARIVDILIVPSMQSNHAENVLSVGGKRTENSGIKNSEERSER